MIQIAFIYFIIITIFFGTTFLIYWTGYLKIGDFYLIEPTSIQDIDEEKRFSRPYTFITPISSSNITSVEDFYIPKFFDNDNISVHFREGDRYEYRIGLGPDHTSGSLIIYHGNGSELGRQVWQSGEGSFGGGIGGGGLEGGENLILIFSGRGNIIFLPASTNDLFWDPNDYAESFESGIISFYLPNELIDNTPDDRRILAKVHSNDGSYFQVRFYDGELHFLGEAEGSKGKSTEIPAGKSNLILAVVYSEGNLTVRFSYSDPIPPQMNLWGWILIGGFLISLICIIIIVVLYKKILLSRGFLTHSFRRSPKR